MTQYTVKGGETFKDGENGGSRIITRLLIEAVKPSDNNGHSKVELEHGFGLNFHERVLEVYDLSQPGKKPMILTSSGQHVHIMKTLNNGYCAFKCKY